MVQVLMDQAAFMASSGITSVWLPPPSDSVSPQGYLPRDLYTLNSAYGTEGELRECLRTLHDCNLKAIADIVINHRCAHFQVLSILSHLSVHCLLVRPECKRG